MTGRMSCGKIQREAFERFVVCRKRGVGRICPRVTALGDAVPTVVIHQ